MYPKEGNYYSRASLAEKNRIVQQTQLAGFKNVSRNNDIKHKFETVDSVAQLQSAKYMGNSKAGSIESLNKAERMPMKLPEIKSKRSTFKLG